MRFNFGNFLVLILLLSPSFSIVLPFFGLFVPNEKLAFLFVLLQCVLNGYILTNVKIIKPLFIITFIFILITIIHCLIGLQNFTTFNTAYIFCALPIYINYFFNNIKYTIQNLMWIVLINILISLFQQINMLSDPYWVNIFNNYPYQSEYLYPNNDFGFYRTSGLFNESSQYSLLLAIYCIFFINKLIRSTIFSILIFVFSIIEMILNQSTSALIIFSLYVIYFTFINKKYIIIPVFSFIYFIIYDLIYIKIENTLNLKSDSYPRLLYAIESLSDTLKNSFFFGRGLSWDFPTWDIYSIYFSGFGIFGFTAIIFFIILIYRRSIFLFPLFFIATLVNGNLLISVNIFMICLIFNFKYLSNENIHSNSHL